MLRLEQVRVSWAKRRERWPYLVRWQGPRDAEGGRRQAGYYWTRRWTPENGGPFRVVRGAMGFEWGVWWYFQRLELIAAVVGCDPQWLGHQLRK